MFNGPYYYADEFTSEEKKELELMTEKFSLAKAVIEAKLPFELNLKYILTFTNYMESERNNIVALFVNGNKLEGRESLDKIIADYRRGIWDAIKPFGGHFPTLEELTLLQVYIPGLGKPEELQFQSKHGYTVDFVHPDPGSSEESVGEMSVMQGTVGLNQTIFELSDAIQVGLPQEIEAKFLESESWLEKFENGTSQERQFAQEWKAMRASRTHDYAKERGWSMVQAYISMKQSEPDERKRAQKALESAKLEPTLRTWLQQRFADDVYRIIADNLKNSWY